MSLTKTDLQQIEKIVDKVVDKKLDEKLAPYATREELDQKYATREEIFEILQAISDKLEVWNKRVTKIETIITKKLGVAF